MREILDWTYGYRKLMVVDTACELDLFSRLEGRPQTADELAAATAARSRPLAALLDACVGLGLLGVEEGRYANRPVAAVHLVRGRPRFLGDLFRVFAAEAPQWLSLEELVRTGRSTGHGPVEIGPRRFTMAMHALGALGEAPALAEAVDLWDRRDLLDVGCGSGLYSIELCRRYPELNATLFDRPEVLAVAEEIVSANQLSDRITLEPGDMLTDSYGEERDVVLMSDVLYEEADGCRGMVRAAHRALVPGGVLVVRGYFSDPEGDQSPFGALFDLARLFWGEDREAISRRRVVGWLAEAGFTEVRSSALTERSTLIVGER